MTKKTLTESENYLDEIDNDKEEFDGSDEGSLVISGDRKFILEKADRSLSELHRWHKNGRIIVDPEWQRNYVWDKNRASKLIESFLIDIPVPVIYLAKREDGKYEVIDGLQRLTTVFKFLDNEFKLQEMELIPNISGKYFRDIGYEYQNKLEDSLLRSFEMASTSGDMHFIVFERINTGSVKLNDMEIRNCLYRGPLNNLLKELSDNSDMKKSLNQKGSKDRMQDRALVLRFLAFYERTHYKCEKGLKKFLNEFLDVYRNANIEKIEEYRKIFSKCMKACLTVFGDASYRLKSDVAKLNSKSSGEWSTRPNAAIFQVIATSFAKYDLASITKNSDAIYEEYLDMISSDELWVDRVRRATGETTRLFYTFDTWNKRLAEIMSEKVTPTDKRLFSRQLKKEMFDADQTCRICNQKISMIDDAALDHDLAYWRGGRTIPENAQLVHRLCNLKKGGMNHSSQ
ncbi:uncharacterized protein with ParB-like and HNH nuclease domain [Pseudochelatococcus lubricantis]|uniref:Uncharacterized protein with ParB-like and HNH nuclease domain n=1 Tax=Pseudochelatococcus lubricantis TaxID=1538102 RepID=A0ABX0V0Y5_9HYPH|nr:DUF262 domain-containing protein [Pseudochelatococcus lubricantis]NIJ57950.1 uncharacterized protein with ParB-like and HNH nuclease domain [Pseudochelatococcus lubricantis]